MREHKCYGTTTIGERGQTVIPAEARTALGLGKGEKLLVFSMDDNMLLFTKLSYFQKMSEELEKRQKIVKKVLKEQK